MLEFIGSIFGGDDEQDKLIDVVGNFQFYVEPCIQGTLGLHTSTIILTVFEDSTKRRPLPFEVQWARILNGEVHLLETYQESYYNVTPSDIDLKIRAVITVPKPEYQGAAYLYVGPIRLDKIIVTEIEALALMPITMFTTNMIQIDGNDLPSNSCKFRVEKPHLNIMFDSKLLDHPKTVNLARQGLFNTVTIDIENDKTLKARIDNKSVTNILFGYTDNNEEEHKVIMKFPSRNHRDIFYIYLRLVRSIKTAFMDKLIRDYDVLLRSPWSVLHLDRDEDEDEDPGDPGFEMYFLYDLVRENLRYHVRINRDVSRENSDLLENLEILDYQLRFAKYYCEKYTRVASKPSADMRKVDASVKSFLDESAMILDGQKEDREKRKKREPNPDGSFLGQNINRDAELRQLNSELRVLKDASQELRKRLTAGPGEKGDFQSGPFLENSKAGGLFGDISYVAKVAHLLILENRGTQYCFTVSRTGLPDSQISQQDPHIQDCRCQENC